MRTRSLVPRPKTTVISLEARLVRRRLAWLARSFPLAALGKVYEHHVGKALPTCSYTKKSLLTALVNCKARMVSCRYDSFLYCSRSVMTTELVSQSLVGRAVVPSSGSSWLYYILLLHVWNYYKLSTLFQILVLSQVTLGLGLTATEINKKYRNKT